MTRLALKTNGVGIERVVARSNEFVSYAICFLCSDVIHQFRKMISSVTGFNVNRAIFISFIRENKTFHRSVADVI